MTQPTTINIHNLLEERGSRYGSFDNHAKITQSLKRQFIIYAPNHHKLTDSMKEAIDMIFHKLGRIGNGDPFYLDSWIDIIGYTQLVVDELEAAQKAASSSSSSKVVDIPEHHNT